MQSIIFYETCIADEKIKELYQNYLDQLTINDLRALSSEKSQLYFNEMESLWHSSGIVHLEGKLKMYSTLFNRVEIKHYRNKVTKETLETTQFPHNKTGFYETDLDFRYDWIFTEGKKRILEHECLEAILKDVSGKLKLKAYYTPDIKVSVGPNKYDGLNGAILEVQIPDEFTTISAYKIELLNNSLPIEKPDISNLMPKIAYLKSLTKPLEPQTSNQEDQNPEKRFYTLRQLADQAFNEGDFIEAQALAQEYLQLADNNKRDWNYGNAIHHANLIIGRIALKEGNIKAAKDFLLKAGNTPGSPQLNSFGPNMFLAKELLEIGETAVVLEYLELCGKFWQPPFQQMSGADKWKERIENGQIPDFGGNMFY